MKNISTIQNPTIRYFAMFLANTFFGWGDMGKITSQDLSVLVLVLHRNVRTKPNLGALLIHHFRRQRANRSGKIQVGCLIIQIALFRGYNLLGPTDHVAGPTTMDRMFLIHSRYLGKYEFYQSLCVYNFFLILTVLASMRTLLFPMLLLCRRSRTGP
jgi:hypothetical protein